MKQIEEITITCLDDIETGKATLDECLDRHHEIRSELEPLLRLALDVDNLPKVVPSVGYKARARASLMEYIHSYPLKLSRWQWVMNTFSQLGWSRVGVIALTALVIFVSTGAGTAYASQSSLPGDYLYPVKTGTEAWRAWIETDTAADASLQLEFAARRIEEIEQLAIKSPSNIPIATSGYEKNLERALMQARTTMIVDLLEDVAIAASNHLNRLESVEDADDGGPRPSIVEAEQVAFSGHMRSLRHMSESRPIRASELTVVAMHNRINRAAGASSVGKTIQAEKALRHFLQLAALSEEIHDHFTDTEVVTSIEELLVLACRIQQQLFASFSNQVSPSLANEVNMAFQRMERNRADKQGQESSDQGLKPGNKAQGPSSQSQGKSNQSSEPRNQEQDGQVQMSGDQGPKPTNHEQELNQELGGQDQTPDGQSPGPGNQGQESGNQEQEGSGVSGSGGKQGN